MRYKTKININGAELLDEQSDTASSITGVQLATACGNGFQIGGTASSQLSLTVLKPYKDRFDGDKIDFYIFEVEDTDTTISELVEEVGDSTETVAVEDDDQNDAIETAEDEEEGEEVTEEEEAEATTEADSVAANLYDIMNGEEETEETEEVEEDTEQGWILYGSFYVYKQTNNSDGSITLSAYDGFSLMNGTYTPGITSGTFQQYYDDLRTQLATLGVVMDEGEWDDTYTITWNQVASYREAAGYLAGLQGGFATFGDDNTLGISQYGYNEGVLLKSAMQTWKETSSGQTEIDSIICTTNLAGNTILAGEDGGQPLSFYNPFMTQDILDNILTEYNGITYTGAVCSCNWDAGMLSGELVRVMSDEEFKNLLAMQNAMANSSSMTADEVLELKKQINSVGKSILISSQTISFTAGGETIAEITSYLQTESEKANAPLSPSDAKFRTVTADLIKTKELIADKASITDLEATNANVAALNAKTATMEEAIAGKVSADEVAAKYATIENLDATNTTVETLTATKANVTDLTAATGRIDALETSTVKTSELDVEVAARIKNAEIDGAQIKDATIESAKLKSINGNLILDGSIIAAALSQEAVKNFNNNNIYYQAEAPTEGIKEGDLWFKTVTATSGDNAGILYVYSNGAWAKKPFDSESILAKSITAGEIASGTITAGEINMDNLQSNIAYIGDVNGRHVQIDSDRVDIKNGTHVLASFGEDIKLSSDSNQYIGGDDARIYFNKTDGSMTITGSKITIGAVEEVASDLKDAVDGALYYQYTTGGVTYDVIKNDNTYYYIDGDEQIEVAESYLDTDDSGNLVTIRNNGLNDAIDETSERLNSAIVQTNDSIQSLEDVVDKNREEVASNVSAMGDTIQGTYDKLEELNSYLVSIQGKVKISDDILVGSESGYNIKITDTAINLREKQTNLASMDGNALNIPTADITFLRLGKCILEAMEDGSLVLKAR